MKVGQERHVKLWVKGLILKEDVGYLNKPFEAVPRHLPVPRFLLAHHVARLGLRKGLS